MSNGETETEKRVRELETVCAAQAANYETMTETVKDHEERIREIEKLTPALRIAIWADNRLEHQRT